MRKQDKNQLETTCCSDAFLVPMSCSEVSSDILQALHLMVQGTLLSTNLDTKGNQVEDKLDKKKLSEGSTMTQFGEGCNACESPGRGLWYSCLKASLLCGIVGMVGLRRLLDVKTRWQERRENQI